MMDEKHRALKRWERARQMASLSREMEEAGPAAPCLVRGSKGEIQSVSVFILEIFSQDLVCVKSILDTPLEGAPALYWLVRGGIDWVGYLPRIVLHYRQGLKVPRPFRPIRKLGGELVARLEAVPPRELPKVFEHLRASGLLPAARPLSQETCPPCLAWDRMRSLFQDFKAADAA
jgi:hypothetical protein